MGEAQATYCSHRDNNRFYRREETGYEVESAEIPPKPWWAIEYPQAKKPWWSRNIVAVILVIAAINFGVNTYYGEKDPVVSILDKSINIECNYGLDVYFSDITSVSLLERSMRDIGGGGIRAGGYGGFGGAARGNFQLNNVGNVLLFVQYRSSPTIWIERYGKKDIYLSFRDGKKTGMLYNEMKAAIKK